jgi:hypothetical protein
MVPGRMAIVVFRGNERRAGDALVRAALARLVR